MLTLTFICRGLKARTDPCREGGASADALGIPKDQQVCHCEKFVKCMARGKGIPVHHTCIRELGGVGTMVVVEDESDKLRIDVRLQKPIPPDNIHKMLRYLEGRHAQVLWRQDTEGSSDELIPMVFSDTVPPMASEPPPELTEEVTPPEGEPRPRNVTPEEIARRSLYRGPIAEPH